MGLADYLMMGFGISGLYIAVKYGPQIYNNIKGSQGAQAQPQAPPQQPSQDGQPISNIPSGPQHQNDTGTYRPPPKYIIRPHQGQGPLAPQTAETIPQFPAHNTVIPTPGQTVPSNSPHPGRGPPHIRHHEHIKDPGFYPDLGIKAADIDASKNCICTSSGVYKAYPGQICDMEGMPCTPKAYLGYFDGYEMAVPGPQWRKTIPNRQLVANQAMVNPRGRVRRALAANNHNFMPGGFVLSEASVRRGINNVYSAGT